MQVFQDLLKNHYESSLQNDILSNLRQKAWDHFLKLGLPQPKGSAFSYVSLRRLYSQEFVLPQKDLPTFDFSSSILPECEGSVLVFVDGFFQKSLSQMDQIPKKVVILNLSDAMKSYGVFLQNHITQALKEEKLSFAALNAALQTDGMFLYAPADVEYKKPIQLIHIVTKPSSFLSPRFQIYVGKRSSLSFYQTFISKIEEPYFMNHLTDVQAEEESLVKWTEDLQPYLKGVHLHSFRATVKKSASLKYVGAVQGSKCCFQDFKVALLEEHANCDLSGLIFSKEDHEAHTRVLIDHRAPHTYSSQLFKTLLTDQAKSSFSGNIYVRDLAQKTRAYQLNRNLLLSDSASVYTVPNLEIFADDVKASHGASVSMPNEEEIFYLKSRGLSSTLAEKVLVKAFAKEILDKTFLLKNLNERICDEIT